MTHHVLSNQKSSVGLSQCRIQKLTFNALTPYSDKDIIPTEALTLTSNPFSHDPR